MNVVLLRRAGLFTAIAGLGIALAVLLAGDHGARPPGPRPVLPVVDVPPGTDLRGSDGSSGATLVGAEGIVVSRLRQVTLEDGSVVSFRSMVLRAASEAPLPSPARGVTSLALTDPDLEIVQDPRDRKDLEAAGKSAPLRLRAPRGILLQGPGEERRLLIEGGVRVDMEKEGVPWRLEGEAAEADLVTRRIVVPGAVTISSADLEAAGTGLEAEDGGGRILLHRGARGEIRRATGARIGGLAAEGKLHFACSGPFLLERLTAPPPSAGPAAPPGAQWFRITLEEAASLEQGEGRLEAPRIEVDLRRTEKTEDDTPVQELRASGGAVLTGDREGKTLLARAREMTARPGPGGSTDISLTGDPSLELTESRPGGASTTRVSSVGPAGIRFPSGEGPVTGMFRGAASATLLEEPADGSPPILRTLTAGRLRVEALRGPSGGPTTFREVVAEGDALLREGDRTARARVITFTPTADGGSLVRLSESVAVHWPAAGLLDPLSSVTGEVGRAAAEGSLLLAAPRQAELLLPPPGATDRGAVVTVAGGAVLRRIVGEQEVYRLNCGRVLARMFPGNRGIELLEATVDVRLEGREENAGARRYDLRGDRLVVAGSDPGNGKGEPRTFHLEGAAPARAFASFTADDGRPIQIAADRLQFDRTTGDFRAEGDVRGEGVLTEGVGSSGSTGGRAEIACPLLTGVLEQGAKTGTSRLRSVKAGGPVWVRTETEFASGDSLRWDAAGGVVLLEGAPAKITARSGAAVLGLEDRCEAPVLRLTLAGGRLVRADAERGGTFIRHRVPDAADGKDPLPPERLQARCSGPLLYTPGETRMSGGVSLSRSSRRPDGSFEERDRVEGADAFRALHPLAEGPAAGRSGRLASAEVLSPGGGITIVSAEGSWKADGVSRIDFQVATGTVLLEASMSNPRFRLEGKGSTSSFRRVVYDYRRGLFTEQVGAVIGDGR